MTSVKDIIAGAIKAADRSLFNEDYGKQAEAVLIGLRKAGYDVVPLKPSDQLIEYISQNMPFGRSRPTDLIKALYTLMVENSRRLG
ncbi:MAG: hypothetical protein P4M00_09215 [Azospirillaceae bacterium]|nr:hypothetical protein [Azospirillaceae bacterium]